ncbi:DNA repair protein rad2 [Bachmanniomyces sp. S44760]|nr:DNA repair protein rad2 [Bachmanniomyces sp. S44760]
MGVTGLWTVVQPCARPIKIETLNKKRLAVDASIWIYQFLKAVRDKEGNALRNSHVVGFFRRICKLLFFGIKPVFVFDGGAPALKRQTVSSRKARREGRREDAVRTAGKLLALQMQRRAEEDDRIRREERDRPTADRQEQEVPENPVYVDELTMTTRERQQNRTFRKKDAYHLPELDANLADLGAPNDPRIMSSEELEEYARQFHTGEDVNIYDFSKIDFNGPFFLSLPASDKYNILNAARLRSRLRMGYSKDQLDTMFPDRMAFSKFQIDRVKERNELTQRLMNINGMNGEEAMLGLNGPGRVAGEKGREYVLVKNDGVEGGWALGVVSNKSEGERNRPINVDELAKQVKEEVQDDSEEDGFEDVPIEGLNRLPRRLHEASSPRLHSSRGRNNVEDRWGALYEARQQASSGGQSQQREPDEQPSSLFLPQSPQDHASPEIEDELFEDVPGLGEDEDEDNDLDRAIAMSLESPDGQVKVVEEAELPRPTFAGPRIDQPLDFNKKNAQAGRSFAHWTNARAKNARAHGAAPTPFADDVDDDDDLNLEAALAESKKTMHKPQRSPEVSGIREQRKKSLPSSPLAQSGVDKLPTTQPFSGPLPFESISLGKSILTKKKVSPLEEPRLEEGGFEREADKENVPKQLPPWFSGDIREHTAAQRAIEEHQYDANQAKQRLGDDQQPVLKRQKTSDVIDVDDVGVVGDEIIDLESSNEDTDDLIISENIPIDADVRMGDVADLIRAEPPVSRLPRDDARPQQNTREHVEKSDSEIQDLADHHRKESDAEDSIEWSESGSSEDKPQEPEVQEVVKPAGGNLQPETSKSPSPEFENVGIASPSTEPETSISAPSHKENPPPLPTEPSIDIKYEPGDENEEDIYSDPEDEDLMRQLATEAEEHARFASTLNSKSQLQNAEDYERELRQLRNQQKKDRRDADEVSHIMITECQQLLKLFGLPYITAPMEAEAQCAELVTLGLVDGIVTDDSDIFLFGGTRVYKNMFNAAKFVECYLSSDLEKEYSLDRHKLIQIAHLLGSDYTEGLPSVGPVTALEILSEFSTLDAFKEWWTDVQNPLITSKPTDPAANTGFKRKFRRNATKLFLPPVFPDTRVDAAYLNPEVDSDPSAFAWGVPDLDSLRSFLMATIGWTQERTDEVLVPVIRDMNRREAEGTQANITQFFGGGVGVGARVNGGGNNATSSANAANTSGSAQAGYAPRRRAEGKSKRMETALGRLHAQARKRTHGEDEDEDEDQDIGEGPSQEEEAEAVAQAVPGEKLTGLAGLGAATEQVAAAKEAKASKQPKKPRKPRTNINRLVKSRANEALNDGDGDRDGMDTGDDDDDDDREYNANAKPNKRRRRGRN